MSTLTFDASTFRDNLLATPLAAWSGQLIEAVNAQGHALKHGHLTEWEDAVAALPAASHLEWAMINGVMTLKADIEAHKTQQLRDALQALIPWRKGPYAFGDIHIDTEWRSDWKWDRIQPHIQSLHNRAVLDVGCGNGYHLWAMRAGGASQVLGIDPSLHYLQQFRAVQHYASDKAVQLLPLPMESLPPEMNVFDTVFSMGVLYHRKDPHEHLAQLRQALRPAGEVVVETLVIDDTDDIALEIPGRYANMRNVYSLPSTSRLERWLAESGFQAVRTVSLDQTTLDEQRSTAWMPRFSLAEALDSGNTDRTIEGHPRPLRAVCLATV